MYMHQFHLHPVWIISVKILATEFTAFLLFLLFWRHLVLCKGEKYLLQCGLMHGVIVNIVLFLGAFHYTKYLRKLGIIVRNSEMHVALICVKHFDVGKNRTKVVDERSAACHSFVFHLHATEKRVPVAEFVLEMLGAAETNQPSIDHDYDPRTQGITLFHTAIDNVKQDVRHFFDVKENMLSELLSC